MVSPPGKSEPSLKNLEFLLFPLSRGQAIVDVVLVLAISLVFDLAIETLLSLIYGFSPDSADGIPIALRKAMLFPMLGIRAVTTLGLVGAFVWFRRESFRAVGLSKRGLALDGIIGAALTLAIYGIILTTLFFLAHVWPNSSRQLNKNALVLLDLLPSAGPLAFFAMAATIGLYEELLFRGFIMPRLRRATGSWLMAVLLSSTIFTALHAMDQTPAALILVAILSISLSIITIWRRSIVAAIVAHALFDFSQFMFLMLQRDAMQT